VKQIKYFLAGILATLALILIGNLYRQNQELEKQLSGMSSGQTPAGSSPLPSSSPSPSPIIIIPSAPTPQPQKTPPPDPLTQALYRQSNSDDIDTIEKDVNQTDLSRLDQELPAIETAFAKLTPP
jgi:hypothetical protein